MNQTNSIFDAYCALPISDSKPSYIKMDSPATPAFDACHAQSDYDVNSCILIVTVGAHMQDFISRKDAHTWALKVVRKAIIEKGALWEGDLRLTTPMRSTVSGMQYKLQFTNVPEQLMTEVIIPAFQKDDCQVERLSKDAEKAFKDHSISRARDALKRAQAIGDVAVVNSTIDRSHPQILSNVYGF